MDRPLTSSRRQGALPLRATSLAQGKLSLTTIATALTVRSYGDSAFNYAELVHCHRNSRIMEYQRARRANRKAFAPVLTPHQSSE